MEDYKELEERLTISNENIDNLLNGYVYVKLICMFSGKILLKSESGVLPTLQMKKGSLSNYNVINQVNNMMNITVNDIKDVPFKYFNNYQERFYLIKIDEEDILTINSDYHFYELTDMSDESEYLLINNLKGN